MRSSFEILLAGLMAAALLCATQAAAQDYSVIYSFGRTNGDASGPAAGLTLGSDGAFYGTSTGGGAYSSGTIFRISQSGSNCTVIHSFNPYINDGNGPYAGLLQASDGMLYGTTIYGGEMGYGAMFKLSTNGTGYTILRNFQGYPTDGYNPRAKLAEGTNGILYGTTELGGNFYYGTAFKFQIANSNYSIIHHFSNTNGATVQAGVIVGSDGALYGATCWGGGMNDGVIYRLTTDGSNYTVLHDCVVSNVADGYDVTAAVREASDGKLYGTTYYGGSTGAGTVFRLNKDGSGYQSLRSFAGGTDAANPTSALWEGWDGLLYGTASTGGAGVSPGNGVIFKVSKDGTNVYSVAHYFNGGTNDGVTPYNYEGLMLGSDGALYGTTQSGGAYNLGTIFRIRCPALPALSVQSTGSNSVRVSWASPATGFGLLQSGKASGAAWTNCPILPTDDGTNKSSIVPSGGGGLFFRLQRMLP